MASFTNGVITNLGLDLKSKAEAGATLNFKRVVMGDGVPAGGTDLKTMTALINELKGFDTHSSLFLGSGVTRVRCILSNAGLATGFYAKEFGVIADDPDLGEILYAYGTADPGDWIPPETESFQQIFDNRLITGSAETITVTLTPDAATMTLFDMQEHEAKQLDPTDANTVKERHLSNAQGKKWEDHVENDILHRGAKPGDFIFLPYEPTAAQMTARRMLPGNGGSVLDVDFSDILVAWGEKLFGFADAEHFYLPPLCGYFPRFWDHGAGLDPAAASRIDRGDGTYGDNVGTTQNDQNKAHYHEVALWAANSFDINGGSKLVSADAVSTGYSLGNSYSPVMTSGGSEARSKNIYIWGGVFY